MLYGAIIECPRLWRITDLSLVVNKQDQRAMKMAITFFWPFCRFRIEGRKQQKSKRQATTLTSNSPIFSNISHGKSK